MASLFRWLPDLLFSAHRERYWPRRAAKILAFAIFPIGLVLAFWGPWMLHSNSVTKRHLAQEAALERVRLAFAIEQHYYVKASAALEASASGATLDEEHFRAIAQSLLTHPAIVSVEWIPDQESAASAADRIIVPDGAAATRLGAIMDLGLDARGGLLSSVIFPFDEERSAFLIQTPPTAHGSALVVIDAGRWLRHVRLLAAATDMQIELTDGRVYVPESLRAREGGLRGAVMFMGRAYTVRLLPQTAEGGFLDTWYAGMVGLFVGIVTVVAATGLVFLQAYHRLLLRYDHLEAESAKRDSQHREELASMRVQVARQRHQDMSSMARSIAHDIRNRLMQASSVAQTLKIMVEAKIVPDRPPYSHFQNLDREISSINTLLNALISLGSDDDRPLEAGPFPAGNIVTTAWKLNKDVSYRHKVDFQLFAQRTFVIRVDYASVLKATKAVLLNAIEACAAAPGGGRKVDVSIFQTLGVEQQQAVFDFSGDKRDHLRAWICIQVRDSGVGIAPEDVEKVFWPTYSTKAGARGHGLPSVVREIERHKGVITLSSIANEGTTVRLYFEEAPPEMRPVASAAAVDNVPVPFTRAPSLEIAGTALVVDDEQTVRGVLCDYLAAQGLQVIDASTGEEALEMLLSGAVTPDIVVLDHRLGIGVGGQEVAEAIRGKGKWKIIHVSATTSTNLDLPDDEAFLQKPFGPAQIQAALRRVLNLPPRP